MVDRKDRFALLSRFKKLCKDNGRPIPQINMNVDQWAADALIQSYGLPQCYDIMDYYFSITLSPSWSKFANNAGRLLESQQIKKEDDEFRRIMRAKVEVWLGE